MRGASDRTARFVYAIALVEADRVKGFGYDPLFYCPAFGCTFGEATAPQKFSLSHRGQALRAVLAALQSGGRL